jgi:hypothetical protein
MDIQINIANSNDNNQIEIDQIKFQKMVFLYNALDNGWSIKKRNNSYIFSKNMKGKKKYLNHHICPYL